MSTDTPLQLKFLVDYENCADIDEDIAKLSTWIDLAKTKEYWSKLMEIEFEEKAAKLFFEEVSVEKRQQYFAFAISCLVLFVQRNFTGPFPPEETYDFFDSDFFSKIDFVKLLSSNNEEVNCNAYYLPLLAASKVIFATCHCSDVSNLWWNWRTIMIHQQILDELSPGLLLKADHLEPEIKSLEVDAMTKAKFYIEMAQMYLLYRNSSKTSHYISLVTKILEFKYQVLGKLGKRTRFQENSLAQMAVEVTLTGDVQRTAVNTFELPKNVQLGDDLRLETTEYSEDNKEPSVLPILEQKLLLLIIQEMLISRPIEQIFYEELEPCINLLLSQKNTWCVRVVTLMIRSKLESKHKRTVRRSFDQVDEILKCIKKDEPHFLNRVAGVYSTGMMPFWKTLAQYADLMLKISLVKKALEYYTQLELWDQVILCYILLKMKHKATEVIKQQLTMKPTDIKLWCMLGDVTDDVNCYKKAWELSRKCSHRVKRHWGQHFFSKKDYAECIEHFQRSLSINPLQPIVWVRLGFAALETENWQVAATAYRRYTTLEPDNFEAWNNLAQAYLKIGNKLGAHQALVEALRNNYESWKVWENFMMVSVDVKHWNDVIRAYHRLLEMKETYINLEALQKLVYYIIKMGEGRDEGLTKKMRELLGRVTSKNQTEPRIWELYATISPVVALKAQRLQRAYRGYTQDKWDADPQKCQQVLEVCRKLGECALDEKMDAENILINSIRLNMSSAIVAIKKHDWDVTRKTLEEVHEMFNKVVGKVKVKSIKQEKEQA